MTTDDARVLIQNVLTTIGYNMPGLVNLLLGTMAQESAMGKYETQVGGGPARGIFQMEGATFRDLNTNFLQYHQTLSQAIITNFYGPVGGNLPQSADELVGNHPLACAYAACSYIRHHAPNPATDPTDVHTMYVLYKSFYNGPGAATEQEFTTNWQTYGIT